MRFSGHVLVDGVLEWRRAPRAGRDSGGSWRKFFPTLEDDGADTARVEAADDRLGSPLFARESVSHFDDVVAFRHFSEPALDHGSA